MDVYVESGTKRVFAGAIDWPGWCRSARDERLALETLLAYAPRYADVVRSARLGFRAPSDPSELAVVERLRGDSGTDFGVPSVPPSADAGWTIDAADLRRYRSLLRASWRAFDAAVDDARGRNLRTGPRGGGRDLEGIVRHLLGGDAGYLALVGARHPFDEEGDLDRELEGIRSAILEALEAAEREGVAEVGPRGGTRWPPAYFVRRVAWHALDHAWEIEDRAG